MDHFWRPNIAVAIWLSVHNMVRSIHLKHRQSLFWGQSCLEKARQIVSRLDQTLSHKAPIKPSELPQKIILVFIYDTNIRVLLFFLVSIGFDLDFSCAGGNCSLTCCASGHDTANELRLALMVPKAQSHIPETAIEWNRIFANWSLTVDDPGTWRNDVMSTSRYRVKGRKCVEWVDDMSTDSLRHVWARRARSMFLATPGLMRFWRCQWRAQSQTCAALIGGWCLAAGDSHSVHHYSSLFIIYLSFLHIPNIPMSHRQILGASEARRPCQRGSWGSLGDFLTSSGGDRSRISQQGGDRSIQKPTEPKVKETDLRSQTFTDFQHLRAFGGWFPFDWTWF